MLSIFILLQEYLSTKPKMLCFSCLERFKSKQWSRAPTQQPSDISHFLLIAHSAPKPRPPLSIQRLLESLVNDTLQQLEQLEQRLLVFIFEHQWSQLEHNPRQQQQQQQQQALQALQQPDWPVLSARRTRQHREWLCQVQLWTQSKPNVQHVFHLQHVTRHSQHRQYDWKHSNAQCYEQYIGQAPNLVAYEHVKDAKHSPEPEPVVSCELNVLEQL